MKPALRACLMGLVLAACVTPRRPLPERAEQFEARATRCESYVGVHAEAARLAAEGAQVHAAKAECAKASLLHLASTAAGASVYQREFDAMAADFDEAALRRLVQQTLPERADELTPLMALSLAHDAPPAAAANDVATPSCEGIDSHQPLRAASLARTCPSRPEAERLVADAINQELARAAALEAQQLPFAAELHRRVAASLGGPDVASAPTGLSSWDVSRLGCHTDAVPPPLAGVSFRLSARCSKTSPTKPQRTDDARTFEGEQQLEQERIEGEAVAACGAATRRYPVAVSDVALDASGAASALRVRLEAIAADATTWCRTERTARADRDCALLSTEPPDRVEQRFAEHAAALGRWPACFTRWFSQRYGIEPPPSASTRR